RCANAARPRDRTHATRPTSRPGRGWAPSWRFVAIGPTKPAEALRSRRRPSRCRWQASSQPERGKGEHSPKEDVFDVAIQGDPPQIERIDVGPEIVHARGVGKAELIAR